MSSIHPLCITPSPFAYESWFGYVLRISAANGSSSPRKMLKYAGLNEREIKNPPVTTIAALTNKSLEKLQSVAPMDSSGNHQLAGKAVNRFFHDTNYNKVCPRCIQEHGYIDARWDLYHYVACDKHKVWLETTCSNCKHDLSWLRPELLQCKCDATISQTNFDPVPDHLLELSRVISAVFEGNPISSSNLGFPCEALSRLSLQTLVGIVGSLAARNHQFKILTRRNIENPTAKNLCLGAAMVFADWPNNFFTFLEWDGSIPPSHEVNIVERNKDLYFSFFKMGYPWNEVDFLFKYFCLYAKLKKLTIELNEGENFPISLIRIIELSTEDLAAELGVNIATLKGNFQPITPTSDSISNKRRYDLGRKLLSRDVGKSEVISTTLNIPLNVINAILSDNAEDALHKNPKFKKGLDFDAFALKKHITENLLPSSYSYKIQLVPFDKAMRSRSLTGRVSLLKALVNRQIWSYRNDNIDTKAYLDEKDVEKYLNCFDAPNHEIVELGAAAKLLGCSVTSLSQISTNGLIPYVQYKNRRVIKNSDLSNFQKNYIILASLAKSLGRKVSTLKRICEKNEIRFVTSPQLRTYRPLVILQKDYKKIKNIASAPK